MQQTQKNYPSEHLLDWRKKGVVIFLLILNLQACGGVESTIEASSLTPTPADFKKDWTHDGTEPEIALGK